MSIESGNILRDNDEDFDSCSVCNLIQAIRKTTEPIEYTRVFQELWDLLPRFPKLMPRTNVLDPTKFLGSKLLLPSQGELDLVPTAFLVACLGTARAKFDV
jgi:hypothetical protein